MRDKGIKLIIKWGIILYLLFGFWRWVFATEVTATVEESEYYQCLGICEVKCYEGLDK